ncbi:ABC transporter permease [Pseudarthrobacter sp. SSS035]|uniref:ABC transporter permease n=1 Tax=Pseudarthrobacter sp. SSS035 TaxID=2931399 RepID=UPI00200C0525|nr:ABC transporter permease [Pseudarthrobacter sp. SSS035]
MKGIVAYVIRRIIIGWFLFIGLLSLSFFLVSMLPGSPAKALLGEYATPEDIARLNETLGLDKPLLSRYFDYISNAMVGDFGNSFFTGRPVLDDLLVRVPNTLVYLVPGLLLALLLGVIFGSVAAYRYRRPADRAYTVGSSVLLAVPEFVLALLLIVAFFSVLGIAPAPVGMLSGSDAQPPSSTGSVVLDAPLAGYWGSFAAILSHAALPIVTVGVFFAAPVSKIVRTGMVQALASPQIEFARACGLRPLQLFRYAVVEIRGTIMTYFVIILASSISGAAIIESVFSWPGVGGWSLAGVLANDIPIIQGFVVIMGTASLAGYIVLDVATTLLDPRTRAQVSRIRITSRFLAKKG